MAREVLAVKPDEVLRALIRAEYALVGQSKVNKVYRMKAGRRITIPCHSGKFLHPKVLAVILKESGMTVEQIKEVSKR